MTARVPRPPIPYETNPVFLSFRGSDVREKKLPDGESFIHKLRNALRKEGLNTFFDEKQIQIGVVTKEIDHGIDTSKGYVIVFSEGYPDSIYCLEELARIMMLCSGEYFNVHHRFVIPVFYLVKTGDVENQTGPYAHAFAELERKFDRDKVARWRKAFKDATGRVGVRLRNEDHAVSCINEIVRRIKNELRRDVHQPVEIPSVYDILFFIYKSIVLCTFLVLLVRLFERRMNIVYKLVGLFLLVFMSSKFWNPEIILSMLSKFWNSIRH